MKHEAINRSLIRKVDPRRFCLRSCPCGKETESYALGHDARNDFRPIDENPYDGILECLEYIDWAQGWFDADRALDENDDEDGD